MRSLLSNTLRQLIQRQEPTSAPTPRRASGGRKAVVIAIAAQKGGVGKTTTSVSLASALARFHHQRVLLIDCDPQGHVQRAIATQASGAVPGRLSEVLTGERGLEVMDIAVPSGVDGLDLTPLDPQLAQTEDLLSARIGKELLLREALIATRTHYDVILIDCPPNLGNLTLNGLVAADQVLIPCDPSPLAVHGVEGLIRAIGTVSQRLNPHLDLLGILLTRVDGRNQVLNDAILAELNTRYPSAVLPLQIGVNTALARAQHAGQDIFAFDPQSRGAIQYRALAGEVLALLGQAATG